MTTDTEVLSGEIVPYEEPTPATIFRTSDPATALERMTEVSKLLFTVVEDRELYARIGGRKHLLVSAWTTLGAMLGLFPVVAWTRPNETGDGYVARVEVLTRDGRLVGAAEAECSRAERAWKSRDPFALRSMASTRATSRALRGPLEQVVVLAGYEPAGAEEIAETSPASKDDPGPIPPEHRPTKEQLHRISDLLAKLRELDPETDWAAKAREIAKAPYEMLTKTTVVAVIEGLEAELAEREGASSPE
jgi:hypothetical protein